MTGLILFIFVCVVGTQASKEANRVKACKDSGGVMVEVAQFKTECKKPEPEQSIK